MTHDFGGSATTHDLTLDFAYNPASQIASTTRSNDAFAWTSHGSGTTSATSNGVTPSANGLNQIGTWVSTLGHDAKGNITSDGTYGYGYSSENLLTSLTNSASGAIQASSTFAYDPLMRLAVIDSSNAALDLSLGYDGQDIALEESSGKRRRYIHGPWSDEPLMSSLVNTSGTFRDHYHADERGSIIAISDSTGTAGTAGKYDEYGVGTGVSHFHYTGQYWLVDAQLHYYKARIYDARLGRFLQPDPIGYGSGMNMYAYVVGDPVNLVDPSGLKWVEACVGGGATMDCGWHWVGGGGGAGGMGGGGGRFEPNMVGDGGGGGGDLAAGPIDPCKSDLGSYLGAAREVLDVVQTAADVATVGTLATGVGAPVAGVTKAFGIGLEITTGLVNVADGFVNSNWGPLIDQASGAATRIIPGGKLAQMGLKHANKGRRFRDSSGRFTQPPHVRHEQTINEATKQGLQNTGSGVSNIARCQPG